MNAGNRRCRETRGGVVRFLLAVSAPQGKRFLVTMALGLCMALAARGFEEGAELEMTLWNGLFHGAGPGGQNDPQLIVDLARMSNGWERVWGTGLNYSKGDHYGRVTGFREEGGALHVALEMQIQGCSWQTVGGRAQYAVELTRQADGSYAGSFTGAFRRVPVRGRATMLVKPPRPIRPGAVPVRPGEHPRMLFRKNDLPSLRKKAKTPFGQAAVERMRASDDPVALGVIYQLTGDTACADRALAQARKTMAERGNGYLNLGQVWGGRMSTVAFAYDLCHDAWPSEARAEVDAYFRWLIPHFFWNLRVAQEKANWHPCSNYHGPMRGGAALGALALWGDTGPEPARPRAPQEAPYALTPASALAEGLPVNAFVSDTLWNQWLVAGPFTGEHTEDLLAGLGGLAKARPGPGTAVTFNGETKPFIVYAQDRLYKNGDRYVVDMTGGRNQPWHTTVVYAGAVEVAAPKLLRVTFGKADESTLQVYLAGQRVHQDDFVRLVAGRYPVTIQATLGQSNPWGRIFMQPRGIEVTEEEATRVIAERHEDYQALLAYWAEDVAAWRASGGLDQTKAMHAKVAERHMYHAYRWMMGDGGFQTEGETYTAHGADCPLQYALAYRNAFGRDVSPYPDVTHFAARYLAAAAYLAPGKHLMQPINGGGGQVNAKFVTVGFPLTPEALKPGALWGWNQVMGVTNEATRARALGAELSFAFVNYPLDIEPDAAALPKHWAAETKGLYVFRSGTGPDAFVTQVFLKSQVAQGWSQPNAGTLTVTGLGKVWADAEGGRGGIRWQHSVVQLPDDPVEESACGRRTACTTRPDGGGTIAVDLNDLYGKRATYERTAADGTVETRSHALYDKNCLRLPWNWRPSAVSGMRAIAVDYSGASGAPCLLAVADRIVGGGERTWLWQIPSDLKKAVVADARGFTLTQGDATLRATVVSPAEVAIEVPQQKFTYRDNKGVKTVDLEAVLVRGQGSFLVVITIQRGPAPAVTVDGEGIRAVVRVGGQTVRFDGEQMVVSAP